MLLTEDWITVCSDIDKKYTWIVQEQKSEESKYFGETIFGII